MKVFGSFVMHTDTTRKVSQCEKRIFVGYEIAHHAVPGEQVQSPEHSFKTKSVVKHQTQKNREMSDDNRTGRDLNPSCQKSRRLIRVQKRHKTLKTLEQRSSSVRVRQDRC